MTNILKILRSSIPYFIIVGLIIFKGPLVNLVANINTNFKDNTNTVSGEIKILQQQVLSLKKELQDITDISEYAKYGYDLTRVSYRSSYMIDEFYIYGGEGKKYQKNMALVNKDGLVGIIKEVRKDYSKAICLKGIDNLSVVINSAYGTLKYDKEGFFTIEDISNYDDIHINDLVYTSSLGTIKERILIGTVSAIDELEITKRIYVKSNVDFSNLSFLYVIGDL